MRPPPSSRPRTGWILRAVLLFVLVPPLTLPAILWTLGAVELERAKPAFDWVQSISVPARPQNQPVFIGRQDLGQRVSINSASDVHLAIHQSNGTWWLRNVAPDRLALLIYKRDEGERDYEFMMRRWRLDDGDIVAFPNGTTLTITDIASSTKRLGLAIQHAGQNSIDYAVNHETGVGPRVAAISDPSTAAQSGWIGAQACPPNQPLRHFMERRLASRFGGITARNTSRRIVQLGGIVGCGDRLAVREIDPGDAWIEYLEGEYFIAARPDVFDLLTVQSTDGRVTRLSTTSWPVSGFVPSLDKDIGRLEAIILGRTRYKVAPSTTNDALVFTPESRIQRFMVGPVPEDREQIAADHMDCILGYVGRDTIDCADAYAPRSSEQASLVRVAKRSDQPKHQAHHKDKTTWDPARRIGFVLGTTLFAFGFLTYLLSFLAQGIGPVGRAAQWVNKALAKAFGRGLETVARLHALAGGGLVMFQGALVSSKLDDLIPFVAFAWFAASVALSGEVMAHLARRQLAAALMVVAFWVSLGLILAFGSTTLQLLAIGSPNSSWDIFSERHHMGLALLLGATAIFLGFRADFWRGLLSWLFLPPRLRSWRVLPMVLILIAVTLLSVAMFAVGTEEGFMGIFQPSEINKFALLLVAGTLLVQLDLASRYSRISSASYFWRWSGAIVFIAVISGFNFMAVPLRLFDFSPILVSSLTLFLLLPTAWIFSSTLEKNRIAQSGRKRGEPNAPRFPLFGKHPMSRSGPIFRRRRAIYWSRLRMALGRNAPKFLCWFCVTIILIGALGTAAYFLYPVYSGLESADRLLQFSQMERRVAVAIDHDRYAEWAGQLRRAWSAMATEPPPTCVWLGQSVCDGLAWLSNTFSWLNWDVGQGKAHMLNDAALTQVPAIQDDLISAFVLGRFGVEAVIALIILQGVFVTSAMAAAFLVFRGQPGNIRDEGIRLLLAILAFGAGCLFFIQWSIAWANLFSWIPIMGQPMTFISYARSHMLGMGLPCLLVILLALRIGAPNYGQRLI